MSVAQVKKRFGEMESYLGRDKESLRRLKLLKDDVNVLRTSLASAEEKAEQAEIIKEAARKRADEADGSAEEMKLELEQLRMVVSGLSSKAEVLTEQLAQALDDRRKQSIEPADKEAAFKRMMRKLEDQMEFCPVSGRNGGKIPKDTMWFNKSDFTTGWSHSEIWMLGASMAALVTTLGTIVLFSDETVRTMQRKRHIPSHTRPFVRWFRKNIRKDYVDDLWDSSSEERKNQAELDCRAQDTGYALFGSDSYGQRQE
jgi:hypothetical protein